MNEILNIVQDTMFNKIEISDAINCLYGSLKINSSKQDVFITKCAIRLLNRLEQFYGNNASFKDLAVSLRQFILFSKNKVRIPDSLVNILSTVNYELGLMIDVDNEVDSYLKVPEWFSQKKHFEKAYNLDCSESSNDTIGDNMLIELSYFHMYRSFAQKVSVYNVLNMPDGYTMLISLPTGSGKSIIGQLASYIGNGLTVVVVPTIALAIDQLRSANQLPGFLKNSRKPRAYYGEMKNGEKIEIINEIKQNKVSLLFISPEALIKSEFNDVLLKAAEKGKIDHFIIDESHLVVDWGEFFRTEFQFLSIYRKKLLQASNKIKTILLSATFLENTVKVLKELFSEGNNWIEVRADSLRKEPMYCVDANKDELVRKNHVLELVHLLPRPMILYVTTKKDAEEWEKSIMENGFKKVEIFYGDTHSDDRKRIINDWAEDRLDLIIATSAFGMGVDKPDIRTILHACIPESPNRFYQEVGRGGRDGLNSLSVISSYTTEDKKVANDLTKRRVLGSENIISRWISLYETRSVIAPDEFWIDTNVKPRHIKEEQITGLTNISWNEYVILFLARNKFISLLDFKYEINKKAYKIQVKIENFSILEEQAFTQWVINNREYEREIVKKGLDEMKRLVDTPFKKCWSVVFSESYTLADQNCNGCPYCERNSHHKSLYESSIKEITYSSMDYVELKENDEFGFMGNCKDLWINYGDVEFSDVKDDVEILIGYLIENDIRKIIVPNSISNSWELNLDLLGSIERKKHCIFSLDEIEEIFEYDNTILLSGKFLIIFGEDDIENNTIFKLGHKIINYYPNNKVIYLSHSNLYIKSYHKNIDHIINGYSIELKKLLKEIVNVI
jgi:superfamily II DNA or RNA helicase